MPKAKTMLDELARVLKTRKDADRRLARREAARNSLYRQKEKPWYDDEYKRARKLEEEGFGLYEDLSNRAVMEYDRLMRSKPGKRAMQKAWDMLPPELDRDHGLHIIQGTEDFTDFTEDFTQDELAYIKSHWSEPEWRVKIAKLLFGADCDLSESLLDEIADSTEIGTEEELTALGYTVE